MRFFKFKMTGFTKSFNLSVAAALVMGHIKGVRRTKNVKEKLLTAKNKEQLTALYLWKSLRNPHQYFNSKPKNLKKLFVHIIKI